MILGKITAKAQTTIPRAVRLALGLMPGDDVVWEIEGDRVVITADAPHVMFHLRTPHHRQVVTE